MIQLGKGTKITVAEFKEYISGILWQSRGWDSAFTAEGARFNPEGTRNTFPKLCSRKDKLGASETLKNNGAGRRAWFYWACGQRIASTSSWMDRHTVRRAVGTEDWWGLRWLGRATGLLCVKSMKVKHDKRPKATWKALLAKAKHSWDTVNPPPSQAAESVSLLECSQPATPAPSLRSLLPACFPPLHPAGREGQSPGSEVLIHQEGCTSHTCIPVLSTLDKLAVLQR